MYGVIFWMDRDRDTALIWCEDQGNVAVAHSSAATVGALEAAEQGDLVVVRYVDDGPVRICTGLKLVQKRFSPGLQQTLLDAANTAA